MAENFSSVDRQIHFSPGTRKLLHRVDFAARGPYRGQFGSSRSIASEHPELHKKVRGSAVQISRVDSFITIFHLTALRQKGIKPQRKNHPSSSGIDDPHNYGQLWAAAVGLCMSWAPMLAGRVVSRPGMYVRGRALGWIRAEGANRNDTGVVERQ